MTRAELQLIATKRQEALCKAGYSNLDSLYTTNEKLRQLYGPDIIKIINGIEDNNKKDK